MKEKQTVSNGSENNKELKYKKGSIRLICNWVTGLTVIFILLITMTFWLEESVISSDTMDIIFISIILSYITSYILSLILLYRFWNVMSIRNGSISPVQSVVFCFIPIYNMIWIYIVCARLVVDMNVLFSDLKKDVPLMNVWIPKLWYIFLFCSIVSIYFPSIATIATMSLFTLSTIIYLVMINKFTNRAEIINLFQQLNKCEVSTEDLYKEKITKSEVSTEDLYKEKITKLEENKKEIKVTNTALMEAVIDGEIHIVKQLLAKGADVNEKGEDGKTALMNAIYGEKIYIVNILLSNGADINAEDDYGWTAFRSAVIFGETEFVKILLKYGVDVNEKDKYGCTALMGAVENCETNTVDILEILFANGANVNAIDAYGKTALMHAVEDCKTNTVDTLKILLANGADINAVNESEETVLSIAKKNGDRKIIKLLEEYQNGVLL